MTAFTHWLGGWGVAPDQVRAALPPSHPAGPVLPPTPAHLETLLATPAGTPLAGWSLGSLLLLRALAAGDPRLAGRRLVLVCPIPAFPAEARAGGRIPLAAVKFLRKWMRRDPLAALADFYQRAGLDLPPPAALPYAASDLEAGLDLLESLDAPKLPLDLPPGASLTLLAGARDPLLDSARQADLLPGLRILPTAGHALRDFAEAL